MQLNGKVVFVILMGLTYITLFQTDAFAGKTILDGRSKGMASIELKAANTTEVANAVKKVFGEDGYQLKKESGNGLQFSRPAGRLKDLSYGGLASSGTWEQVLIAIHDNGSGNYRVECNVYMTEGDQEPDLMDTKVLKLFGREYKRMLRRVKREIRKEKKGEKGQ